MEERDLFKEKENLENEFKKQKEAYLSKLRELDVLYAVEHNKFTYGDIISNETRTIRIDKIEVKSFGEDFIEPYCVYRGEELTKKLKGKGKDGSISQRESRHAIVKIA